MKSPNFSGYQNFQTVLSPYIHFYLAWWQLIGKPKHVGKFFNKSELWGLIYHAFYLQEVFILYLSSSTKTMAEIQKIKLPHITLATPVVSVLVQYSLSNVNYILSHCCVFTFNNVTTSALLDNEKHRNLVCERCHGR